MELSYMVRGADGKQYGPASLELLGGWVREGRLQPQSELKRSDMEHWAPAGDFAELQPLFAAPAGSPTAAVPQAPAATAPTAQTAAQLKSGASWFYWIAGLSLINSIAAFSGSSWRFIIGLGITQVFDELGSHLARGGSVVALALDVFTAGLFVLCGVFAHKAQSWAFILGIAVFALDGLIFLIGQSWLGVAFHLLVLYWLFRGFSACRQIRAR
jgi:hypothetical protein